MARVKRGVTSHRKHKKVLKLTRGHRGGRSKLVKEAKSSLLHAGQYAFSGRKQKKRQFRRLWITQLGNALKLQGVSYSKFINQLRLKNLKLDRKILADMAVNNPADFKQIVDSLK